MNQKALHGKKTTPQNGQGGREREKNSRQDDIMALWDGESSALGTVIRDGFEAALAGGSRLDNPYRGEQAGRRRVWFRGFDEAAGVVEPSSGVPSTF